MKLLTLVLALSGIMLSITVISFQFVSAQPPGTINIEGYVFHEDGSRAENGIPVIITNLDTGEEFFTEVSAPPIPDLAGAYSASIDGSVGHEVMIRAYNETHYGETTSTITSTTTQVNVTMNISRPAEVNVSITFPPDDYLFDAGTLFNVTFNATALVTDAEDCVAAINFTNESVMNVTGSNSDFLGTINFGTTITSYFEVLTIVSGSVNITVRVSCSNDSILFEGNSEDTAHNITVVDDDPPIITIISPQNGTEEKASNEIIFEYNVSDASPIDECRLYINSTLEETSNDITKDTTLNFTQVLPNDFYTWRIDCDDSSSNTGTSGEHNLLVNVHFPLITNISLPSQVNLNPGTTKLVECNVSVEDENGAEDITGVNATFHLYNETPGNPENNISLYYNSSCAQTSSFGNTAEFTCSFNVHYYASNGTWYCNATSIDNQSLTNNNYASTIVDELYALNLSALSLNYGDIPAGDVSEEESLTVFNIGNQLLNVHVRGYGGSDPVSGDGLAMICDSSQNISVENQRFSVVQGTSFSEMSVLSSDFQFSGLSIPRQTGIAESYNYTFWRLQAPPSEISSCNGTLVFSVSG